MGVGASLDFLAGEVSWDPVWMQTAGLEWLYRAAHEPRRLTQRYLVDAYGLAGHLPRQIAANAIQPTRVTSTVQTYQQDNASVISIRGNFKGSLLKEFEGELAVPIAKIAISYSTWPRPPILASIRLVCLSIWQR
jgi:hypothetical protein